MFIYFDGDCIYRWEERDNFREGLTLCDAPVSLRRAFNKVGKYRAVKESRSRLKVGSVATFGIMPKMRSLRYPAEYPAEYIEGRAALCKPWLKLLTGKTKITKAQTVSVRIVYVGPVK